MKERPILFSAAMVRALLDGNKTQTRRALRKQPYISRSCPPSVSDAVPGDLFVCPDMFPTTEQRGSVIAECESIGTYHCMGQRAFAEKHSPYGQPGDRLWVRETFGYVSPDEHERPHTECNIEYRADLPTGCTDRPGQWPVEECAGDPARPRWRPSIHMPRRASRILLEVTAVRVERLQEISQANAIAEGIEKTSSGFWSLYGQADVDGTYSPRASYRALWESINGPGTWAANPWCWVIEFKRLAPTQ